MNNYFFRFVVGLLIVMGGLVGLVELAWLCVRKTIGRGTL